MASSVKSPSIAARRRRLLDHTVGRLLQPLLSPPFVYRLEKLSFLGLPARPRRRPRWPGYWPDYTRETPEALRGPIGNPVDAEASAEATRAQPLRNFWRVYHAWEEQLFLAWWRFSLWVAPVYLRGISRLGEVGAVTPRAEPVPMAPEELAESIRREAARLGLSQVGFANYDPRWTTADVETPLETGSVVICLLEEDYEAEQRAPSVYHEKRSMAQYAEQAELVARLAEHIHSLGYRAQPHDAIGPLMYIPYAVEAGLGQMGLNGQLLTPLAGARCTIMGITTNAIIAPGSPRDFGVFRVCDACQACVRRCPVGAIPAKRAAHRGVYKAKINTARCIATVVQVDGCAVCSKVCPVQRYGLSDVVEHFERTGRILGRKTDDLEGFTWPLDGRFYGADKKPRINSAELLHPGGLVFDASALTALPEPQDDPANAP